ncbi:MAG: hypothetical protein ACOC6S_01900 [Chloroflexota bacterium]
MVLTDSGGLQQTTTLTVKGRTLGLSPSSGPRGTHVTLSSSDLTPNGEVDPNNVNSQVGGASGALTISG